VTTPIAPTDLELCREGERGRRQMLEVAQADLELRFVHVKAPQVCRKSLAELVDANDRGFHDDDVTELTVEGGTEGSSPRSLHRRVMALGRALDDALRSEEGYIGVGRSTAVQRYRIG
jgi:hypothetical protein